MNEDVLSKPASQVFTGAVGKDPTVPELLSLISGMTPSVNAAVDKVNEIIRTTEASLTKAGAGVEAFAEIDPRAMVPNFYSFEPHASDKIQGDEREETHIDKRLFISYERHEGSYRIMLREQIEWETDVEEHGELIFKKPLAECPRDKKLYAVHFLPELLFDIARRLKAMKETAEQLTKEELAQLTPQEWTGPMIAVPPTLEAGGGFVAPDHPNFVPGKGFVANSRFLNGNGRKPTK